MYSLTQSCDNVNNSSITNNDHSRLQTCVQHLYKRSLNQELNIYGKNVITLIKTLSQKPLI